MNEDCNDIKICKKLYYRTICSEVIFMAVSIFFHTPIKLYIDEKIACEVQQLTQSDTCPVVYNMSKLSKSSSQAKFLLT